MSSPVHHPRDLDAALIYAPPWARKARSARSSAADLPIESPPTSPEFENAGPAFVGDRAMLALQRRLSLDPDVMPEPPLPMRSGLRVDQIALRLASVGAVAALVAWAAIWLPAKLSANKAVQAGLLPTVTAAPAKPVTPVQVRAAIPAPVQSAMQTPAMQAAPPILPAALYANAFRSRETQPRAAEQQANQPQTADNALALSGDEIAMLVKRGKDDLMNGDFASARLLLRRAAEAGSAEAALALGSTFDPLVLERLHAVGIEADEAKARQWYRKAEQLGSNLAARQLARFAGAGR